MKKTLLFAALGLVLVAPAQAEESLVVSVKRLTLDTAMKIAQATVAACRQKGIQVGVTVVDRDGTVQVKLRDTIAAPLTLDISRQKAYTAANFNSITSTLRDRADSPIGRFGELVLEAGGVPIQVGGSLLGAVGVSGAPGGETDEECAQAGVAAVQDDLEMM